MSKKAELSFIFLILLFTLVIYLPILNGFFQNDEWAAFARFFVDDQSLPAIIKRSLIDRGHFVPLYEITYRLLIKVFGLGYAYYAVISIILHLVVVFLVFVFSKKIFKGDTFLAYATSILFAVNAAGHQATTWPLIDINTHGAVVFSLLSLLFILGGHTILSLFSLVISLLFKEITLGFLVFLPILVFMFSRKAVRSKISSSLLFFIVGILYIVFRLINYLLPRDTIYTVVTDSTSKFDILKNLLGFPVKAVYETIFPPRLLLLISHKASALLPESLTGLSGTTAFDIFSERISLPVIGILIVSTLIFIFLKNKKKNLASEVFLIGLFFVILNSFVYALSPERPDPVPIIDSRNLYFPAIGSSLMLVSLFSLVFNKNKKMIIFFVSAFVTLNIFWLRWEINSLVSVAQVRKTILVQIKEENQKLPDRVIFYVESDKSYYGMPETEHIMPFQTNFGLNLFTWYAPTESFPSGFVDENYRFFLSALTEEGYREIGLRGFGYFRSFEFMKQAVQDNHLSSDFVIAYRYNSGTGLLENISGEIRQKL